MKARSGTTAERATAVIAAGCDVALECSGRLDEAQAAAAAVPALAGRARQRFEACLAVTRRTAPFDRQSAEDLWRLSLAAEAARAAQSV
jgi:beta-N-acetylhexosaminidase